MVKGRYDGFSLFGLQVSDLLATCTPCVSGCIAAVVLVGGAWVKVVFSLLSPWVLAVRSTVQYREAAESPRIQAMLTHCSVECTTGRIFAPRQSQNRLTRCRRPPPTSSAGRPSEDGDLSPVIMGTFPQYSTVREIHTSSTFHGQRREEKRCACAITPLGTNIQVHTSSGRRRENNSER
jgi:hypothetical protein